MFTLVFWRAALERAIWTFAQTLIALTIVSNPFELSNLNWGAIFVASGISGGLSLVKSLAVAGATDGSPSVVGAEKLVTVDVKSNNGSLAG